MKKMLVICAVVMGLAGCSDAVQIPDSTYGVKVDSSRGADFNEVYSGNTMLLAPCINECDYALTVDRSLQTTLFEGKFMVNASDLEIDLGVKVVYKLRGTSNALEGATLAYPSKVVAARHRHISGSTIGLLSIEPYGRDAIRNTINDNHMTVEDIMANLDKLREGVKGTLDAVVEGSPVEIIDVRISTVGWPDIIIDRKTELKGLATQEEIQSATLEMERRVEAQRQAVRIIRANNDLDIDKIYKPNLDDKMVTWQVLEVLDKCAGNANGCNLIIGDSLMPVKARK